MRILEFKKGQPVPEWIASMNSKWLSLFFLHNIQIVKNGPYYTFYIESFMADERDPSIAYTMEVKDERPKWLRLIDKIRCKKYRADLSRIKAWHNRPFSYDEIKTKE